MRAVARPASVRRPYSVKSIFLTLQGEGLHSGRCAVFCRFTGCNLWSGREDDRAKAVCRFCDTDFLGVDGPGGGVFGDAEELAMAIVARWPSTASSPFVVFTGGEPALQLDEALLNALHARDSFVAVETNGTKALIDGIDWICVSPKAGTRLLQRQGDELKVVWPQEGIDLNELVELEFTVYTLQPCDDAAYDDNLRITIETCLQRPPWRLGLQTHKFLGIP